MTDDAGPAALRSSSAPEWSLQQGTDTDVLSLSGDWTALSGSPAEAAEAGAGLREGKTLRLDGSALGEWDSRLMAFVFDVAEQCRTKGVAVDPSGLPGGAQRLLGLATEVAPAAASPAAAKQGFVTRVGAAAIAYRKRTIEVITFVGEVTLSLGRAVRGRARFKRTDLWLYIQQCGADALPIVSLISFLVGLILAFVGAVQLREFGAEIFVADLVGIAMVRDMGGIMAAIVMAGRTGASFAAQLGTMQVNEEIDALKTFGIPAIDFLVLPRMVALMLMLPLLTIYADLMGIVGGSVIAALDATLTVEQYWRELIGSVSLVDLAGGLVKSVVYGALVAVAGCLHGMECGRSAAAVGQATTSAVVSGIVSVVTACAILTVVYNVIGI